VVDAIFEKHRTERPPKARPHLQRGRKLGRNGGTPNWLSNI